MKCPMCKAVVVRAKAGKLFPFCSERCQLVDLGRWLGEEYRVPDLETMVEIPSDDAQSKES